MLNVISGDPVDNICNDSLWASTSAPGPELHQFSGTASTDVAIIGAGVAGLSTALHLAEAGISVTVLEADDPGAGATGVSGGLIAPEFIRHTPSKVESTFGEDYGKRLIRLIGSSAQFCFDLIGKHGLTCQANQGGFWTPAHDFDCAEKLLARAKEWADRGFSVRYADAEETWESLGSDRYRGALVFADGGTINPLAFSRELAATALKYGAVVHARSRVIELTKTGGVWSLKTAQGVLKASRIVLAANGGNSGLHPRLRKTALPLDVIEYATVPLTTSQQAKILKDKVSFTDKQRYIFTARYDAEQRLIAAFPDFMFPRSQAALRREAVTRIEQHYPALKGIEIQHLWPGRAWINTDLLPKIYALDQDAYAIQACNGRGLPINTALGAAMAEALVTRDFSKLPVRVEEPRPIPAHFVVRYVPSMVMFLAHTRSRTVRLFR